MPTAIQTGAVLPGAPSSETTTKGSASVAPSFGTKLKEALQAEPSAKAKADGAGRVSTKGEKEAKSKNSQEEPAVPGDSKAPAQATKIVAATLPIAAILNAAMPQPAVVPEGPSLGGTDSRPPDHAHSPVPSPAPVAKCQAEAVSRSAHLAAITVSPAKLEVEAATETEAGSRQSEVSISQPLQDTAALSTNEIVDVDQGLLSSPMLAPPKGPSIRQNAIENDRPSTSRAGEAHTGMTSLPLADFLPATAVPIPSQASATIPAATSVERPIARPQSGPAAKPSAGAAISEKMPGVKDPARQMRPQPYAGSIETPSAQVDSQNEQTHSAGKILVTSAIPLPSVGIALVIPPATTPHRNLDTAVASGKATGDQGSGKTNQSQEPPAREHSSNPTNQPVVESAAPVKPTAPISSFVPVNAEPPRTAPPAAAWAANPAPQSPASATAPPAPRPPAEVPRGGPVLMPPVHAEATAPPLIAGSVQSARLLDRLGQSEMHIGLRTLAFGAVEVHTAVRGSEVGLAVASEKGDLRGWMASEVPALEGTLRQHDLQLEQVRFLQPAFSCDTGSFSQSDPQSRSFHSSGRSSPTCAVFDDDRLPLAGNLDTAVEAGAGLDVRA